MSEVREFTYRKPRFQADFRLWLQVQGPDSRMMEAHCYDISEDGMAVEIADPLSVGTIVTLFFKAPHSQVSFQITAKLVSEIARIHSFQFLYSSQTEHDFMQDYVSNMVADASSSKRRPKLHGLQ